MLSDLGKNLFFDTSLSTPPGQSCAACHAPGVGFTGPDSGINASTAVYPGAVHVRFGNRKPPAASAWSRLKASIKWCAPAVLLWKKAWILPLTTLKSWMSGGLCSSLFYPIIPTTA